jgi:transposase
VASAVRGVREWRATGQTAPRPRGGDRRSGRLEARADFLLAKVDEAPDTTLAELREALRDDRGLGVAISTLWRFFERRRVPFKKRRPTRASRTARP